MLISHPAETKALPREGASAPGSTVSLQLLHACMRCMSSDGYQLQSTGHVSDVIGWDAHHSCVPD